MESANWSKGNTGSNLNSKESVFLNGSFAFWSSVAVFGSVPSSKGKLFNFSSSLMEVSLGLTFFTVDPVGESVEFLESSDINSSFASILDSF